MASGTLGSSLKHLRDLFVGGTAVGLSDGELLRRYAASRDESAFAALVARHGPMVAATCRAVLRDHHDAEDAFQATFLVLARKAGLDPRRRRPRRLAAPRGLSRGRPAEHRGEAKAADRGRRSHRWRSRTQPLPRSDFDVRDPSCTRRSTGCPRLSGLPVVLCDLEGLTYEQAAGRLRLHRPDPLSPAGQGHGSGCTTGCIRRGVTAVAVGAALELSQASATAAVPSAWSQAAVAAATGGPIPPTVAALDSFPAQEPAHDPAEDGLRDPRGDGGGRVGWCRRRGERDGFAAPTSPPSALSTAPIADEPKPEARPTTQTVSLTVEARDLSTDALVPDVHLELRTLASETRPTARTDASGTARFSMPADIRYLRLTAAREGFVPQAIRWDHEGNATAVPDHLLFQMEKATKIGGRVVDQDQKPIAGATVVIDVAKGYPHSPQRVDLEFRTTETDANGTMVVHVSPGAARFHQGHGLPPSLPHGTHVLPAGGVQAGLRTSRWIGNPSPPARNDH